MGVNGHSKTEVRQARHHAHFSPYHELTEYLEAELGQGGEVVWQGQKARQNLVLLRA